MIRARALASALVLAWVAFARAAHAAEPSEAAEAAEPKNAIATAAAVPLPARIDEIRIEGLVRTRPHVVRRELGFTEGDVVTAPVFDLAITRLWNTTIFARVDGEVVREGSRHVAVIRVEDRWTLNPLFRFGSGGDALFFRIGAADNNIAGRFLEVQAQYEYFDGFHGGQVIYRDPRMFERRVELTVQADRLVRPRPGFSDQRTQGVVELSALFDQDRGRLGVRTSVFANRFLKPVDSPPFYPLPTETLLIEPGLRLGRIDTVRIRQRGVSFELRPGVGFTSSDVAEQYVSMTGEALGFAMAGERWNFAARVRGANISRVPSHLELFAGGLDLLRGFPDNFVRTRAFVLMNLEARFIAFDSTWLALVPTVFVDAIAARSPAGDPGTALSMGGGVRALIPKFVGTGLRFDLAVPLHANMRAVSVLEQARFGPTTPTVSLRTVQPSVGVYQFF